MSPVSPSGSIPAGTVSFLITDIEGSTRRWQEDPEMAKALARHDEILRESVEGNHGYWVKHTGDGALAAFASASDAINAAVRAQRALFEEKWDHQPLRARMGIHTGEAEMREGDYFGITVLLPYEGFE